LRASASLAGFAALFVTVLVFGFESWASSKASALRRRNRIKLSVNVGGWPLRSAYSAAPAIFRIPSRAAKLRRTLISHRSTRRTHGTSHPSCPESDFMLSLAHISAALSWVPYIIEIKSTPFHFPDQIAFHFSSSSFYILVYVSFYFF